MRAFLSNNFFVQGLPLRIGIRLRYKCGVVSDGGDNVFLSVSFGKKFRTFEKERADVLLINIYKKLWTCAYKE